jgi:hypothetical protein
MNSPEQAYAVPQAISAHPSWVRLEEQRRFFSSKARTYQSHYKRIKLCLIGLAAGIPLIVFLPADGSRYVVAAAGVAIAVLEGLLLLNQYGPLWVKYRSTAEGLNRERWLLLARAGDYAGKPDDEALRQLAERVEAILDTERQEWATRQSQVLEHLAKTQAFVQAHQDETARRAAATAPGVGSASPPAPAENGSPA